MHRRTLLAAAGSLASSLPRPSVAQPARPLRFVPQANLANPDPIWTTATVAANHGYMVWDTLYGIGDALVPQPQMCAGHTLSDDRLAWEFTLRDGLRFHDGEPVRAVDCTTSINRWAQRNPFGAQLLLQTAEMAPVDDRRFRIRLHTPFGQMLYALGAEGCMVMPERMAKTPASQHVMDWGTLVSRRVKQDSPEQGGWNAFCTTWAGLAVTNPGSSFPLQAIGRKGWLGWYSNPKMAVLHDRWFEAPDLAAQKAVCEDMQREAFANPPFVPLGQWKQPWAFRTTLKNFVRCGNVLFWGVERA